MKIPSFRFIDDGWAFNPFHWMGPNCRVDCYPDKLFHLAAGFLIAAAFLGWTRWRRRPAPVRAHVAIVPVVAALKEVYDWLFAQPSPAGFWRDQGPSWRDFVATILGQVVFWAGVWAWRALRGRRARAAAGRAGAGA